MVSLFACLADNRADCSILFRSRKVILERRLCKIGQAPNLQKAVWGNGAVGVVALASLASPQK